MADSTKAKVVVPADGHDHAPEKVTRVALTPQIMSNPESSEDERDDDPEEGELDDSEILADLPDDTEEIELVHSKLFGLSKLSLARFVHLKRLCLRQNYIGALDHNDFDKLVELEDLDLYDNRLKNVGDALNNLHKLTSLDLSFNNLKHVPHSLGHLTELRTIYFVQNKISHITGFEDVGRTLRSLELGGNRIRKIEGLDALVNLEELWLGKNKISKLENLSTLKSLKILSIQSNRIVKLEGIENLENLEELYLSHNGIVKMEGLENNHKLRTLDIGNNFIAELEGISHLTQLEELWMSYNKIPTLNSLEPQLRNITTLETVYLEGNPCQAREGANYRRKVILALPQIKQLDATFIRAV